MKKLIVAMAASAVVMGGASLALANGSGAGIVGSPHDFTDNANIGKSAVIVDEVSATGWNYRAEVCRVCHAPHDKGRTNYTNGLLWNHLASSAAYTMYDSPTLDGVQDVGPGGSSKLCLSCHDGSVALDTFDSHAGATPTGSSMITVYGNTSLPVATNLNGTHPISITYNNVADTGLNDPAVATMADGVTVQKYLPNGKVECSSCHDVHDKKAVAGTHLLRKVNTTSELCLTCHNK